MADAVSKPTRPQLRGLLRKQIGKNVGIALISCAIAGVYMKFVYEARHKKQYADFYLNYDIDKEFERMRKKGLFDSCDTDD